MNSRFKTQLAKIFIATGAIIFTVMVVWSVATLFLLLDMRKKVQLETEQLQNGATWMMLRPYGLWSTPAEWPGTNEDGFRLREYKMSKAPGEWRIAILGGSSVYGTGVTPFRTTPRALQTLCREQGISNVNVLNFGMSGYTSTNELILLFTYVMQFQPDLVIILDGWNDNGTRFYVPNAGPFMSRYKKVLDDSNAHISTYGMAAQLVMNGTQIGRFLLPLVVPESLLSKGDLQIRTAAKDLKRPIKTTTDTSADTYMKNLRAMNGILNSFNIDHLFILQPIDHQSTNEYVSVYPEFSKAFFNACSLTSTPCYDAANLMEGLNQNKRYFIDPVHLTDEGNRLMAAVIFDVLVDLGHFRKPSFIEVRKQAQNRKANQLLLTGTVGKPDDFSGFQLVFLPR